LFGSRVDDHKRGGDIDLLIRLPPHYDSNAIELFKRKICFLGELEKALGEQKIDVVMATPTSRQAIEIIAEQTGIKL
jgi:predicted nucleotidyltransferase